MGGWWACATVKEETEEDALYTTIEMGHWVYVCMSFAMVARGCLVESIRGMASSRERRSVVVVEVLLKYPFCFKTFLLC